MPRTLTTVATIMLVSLGSSALAHEGSHPHHWSQHLVLPMIGVLVAAGLVQLVKGQLKSQRAEDPKPAQRTNRRAF